MPDIGDSQWLIGDEAAQALQDAAENERPLHQRLASLRSAFGTDRAALICDLADARKRGRDKFGGLADRLFGARTQWEQATDGWVAAYKASRFAAAHAQQIQDFCCGMGGDLLAFAAVAPATGWDRDQAAACFAAANLLAVDGSSATVLCGDVEGQSPHPLDAWHVDPDRRATGRRSITPQLHSPTPATIDNWLASSPHGAVKLAPATRPFGPWSDLAEWEWISRGRECRQLVAWFGNLRSSSDGVASRRATHVAASRVSAGHFPFFAHTFGGVPMAAAQIAAAPSEFLFDPDPALVAAELVGAFANDRGLATLGPGSIYLTGDHDFASPLVPSFRVVAQFSARAAAVAKELAARGIGRVEIKTRGVAHDPQQFRRSLKLRGEAQATIFLTRIGARETAILAERVSRE